MDTLRRALRLTRSSQVSISGPIKDVQQVIHQLCRELAPVILLPGALLSPAQLPDGLDQVEWPAGESLPSLDPGRSACITGGLQPQTGLFLPLTAAQIEQLHQQILPLILIANQAIPASADGLVLILEPDARRVAILAVETEENAQAAAIRRAREWLKRVDSVVITHQNGLPLAVHEPVGVLIHPGRQKKAPLRPLVEIALRAGLGPVWVVTDEENQQGIRGLESVRVCDSTQGIQAALMGITPLIGSIFFLSPDRPLPTPEVLRALAERHAQTLDAVLAPYVFDERAHPILYDRVTFAALAELGEQDDRRSIFSKFTPRYLNWYDRSLL